eukprot:7514-Heterococcus_DN1.PRE.2
MVTCKCNTTLARRCWQTAPFFAIVGETATAELFTKKLKKAMGADSSQGLLRHSQAARNEFQFQLYDSDVDGKSLSRKGYFLGLEASGKIAAETSMNARLVMSQG